MARRKGIEQKQIQADWWDPNEIVIIRTLKESDLEWIQDSMADMVADGKKTNANMNLRIGTARRLTMLRGIASWTLTNELGNIMPLTEQALGELAQEDADFIYQAINELNQPLSEQEKKVSLTSASNGSEVHPAGSLSPLLTGQ